jgi:hypothetical protein
MSSEPPPDPLLPVYSPSSWDIPTLSLEERAVLDTNCIKFPVAQNAPIFFTNDVLAPTVATTNNSGLVATTQFVNNFLPISAPYQILGRDYKYFHQLPQTASRHSVQPYKSAMQIRRLQ